MQLTFEDLATQLPAGSIEFVGNNQLKINFTQLTGENLTLESSLIEGIAKFLEGLTKLTTAINTERTGLNPPKDAITFVSKEFDGTPEKPEIVFECRIAINPTMFTENLFDPTAE